MLGPPRLESRSWLNRREESVYRVSGGKPEKVGAPMHEATTAMAILLCLASGLDRAGLVIGFSVSSVRWFPWR